MKRFFHLVILFTLFGSALAQTEYNSVPLNRLLTQLDEVISHKQQFQQARTARADRLRNIVSNSDGKIRVDALKELYDTYLHFQADSTLSVLQMLHSLPEYESDQSLQQYVTLNEFTVYGMMGLYSQANQRMQSIKNDILPESRLHYYNAYHSVLGWMAEYSDKTLPNESSEIYRLSALYHDSIISLEPDPRNCSLVRANKDYDNGNYRACIDTLNNILYACDEGQRIYAFSRLSEAYGKLGVRQEQLRYLTLTAIGDLRTGVTEYMSLPKLACLLFEDGEIERAYRYMFCALEDANLCKANLRTIEVTQFFPIINEAHHKVLNRQQRHNQIFSTILIILAVFLAVMLYFTWRINRKLNLVRSQLAQTNNNLKLSNIKLKEANAELKHTDKIKEEYLTSYLTRSRHYLASTESMQRLFLKLLQTHQLEELQKQLRSTQIIEEEQQRFYDDFDETFLRLYPNFVEKFNALLKPESQILPKKGELLTTELRIFALIRMGETDSTKIAKFLNYSVTTIYNYRSRVRNNAIGDKENFENEVARL